MTAPPVADNFGARIVGGLLRPANGHNRRHEVAGNLAVAPITSSWAEAVTSVFVALIIALRGGSDHRRGGAHGRWHLASAKVIYAPRSAGR